MNYYNDNDERICAWLRELIKAGHIPHGDVDCRSITEVQPDDLLGYSQCHFFCGIAGFPLALKNIGLGETRGIWTGSAPCQPFSVGGKGLGFQDERDLWWAYFRLIKECKPEHVFGEQVEDAIRHGWIDRLQADMESEGYDVGYAVLGAHSVGAPHIRQRLFWVANSKSARGCWWNSMAQRTGEESGRPSSNLCFEPWPDGRGSDSSLSVSDVLAPSYGIPSRVASLHGYGNSIVPQVAEAFITSYFEALNDL